MGKTIDNILGRIERFFGVRMMEYFVRWYGEKKGKSQTTYPPENYDFKKNEEDSLMD